MELPAELRRLGCSRPFLVTDAGVRAAGLVSRVTGPLEREGFQLSIFDRTEPEPPFRCVADALSSVETPSGRMPSLRSAAGA